MQLGEPADEEATLRLGTGEVERALVGGASLRCAVEPAQELRPGRVEIGVNIEIEALERDQPGARVRWLAVARPAFGRDRERFLSGLLGKVEVAEEADQGSEDAAPMLAEGLLDQRSTTGRTSIAPPSRAAGMRAASSIAASRSSASKIK